MNSTLWKIRCSLNLKARVVNKAQRQLRPESYFLECYKSPALDIYRTCFFLQKKLILELINTLQQDLNKQKFPHSSFNITCTV